MIIVWTWDRHEKSSPQRRKERGGKTKTFSDTDLHRLTRFKQKQRIKTHHTWGDYLFFFSFFNFRFSFGLSWAFFWFSLLPLSFFPPSPMSASPCNNNDYTARIKLRKTDCFLLYNKFPSLLQYFSAYDGLVQALLLCIHLIALTASAHLVHRSGWFSLVPTLGL